MTLHLPVKNYYSQIIVIILTALVVQLIGHYYWSSVLIFNNYFLGLWVVMRIIIPAFIALAVLKIPAVSLGLGLPRIDRPMKYFLLICVTALVVFFIVLYFVGGSYYSNYNGSFSAGTISGRIYRFFLFTASTLPGWEFLHRGFLLFGLIYILTEREHTDLRIASIAAILVVTVFESMFHFKKPILESAGFVFGSGILCYIALRTRSMYIPFIIHLIIETLFKMSLILLSIR